MLHQEEVFKAVKCDFLVSLYLMNHLTKIIKTADEAEDALRLYAETDRAAFLPGFFKATPGGYGEGDQFLGVRVPLQRKVAGMAWPFMGMDELSKLLQSPYHECRLTGLFILVKKFEKSSDEDEKKILVDFYLNHPHDLIHKASGWMIREVGKRDFQVSYDFLKKHYQNMPRTMLRYAIEQYPGKLRQKFLKGEL